MGGERLTEWRVDHPSCATIWDEYVWMGTEKTYIEIDVVDTPEAGIISHMKITPFHRQFLSLQAVTIHSQHPVARKSLLKPFSFMDPRA